MDLTKFEGHTPGPWHVVRSGLGCDQGVATVGGEYVPVVRCSPFDDEHGHRSPDCALMAAAPELLEEVTRLRAKVEELRQVLREVEWSSWDEGEGCAECFICGCHDHYGHGKDCRLAAALNDARKGEEE